MIKDWAVRFANEHAFLTVVIFCLLCWLLCQFIVIANTIVYLAVGCNCFALDIIRQIEEEEESCRSKNSNDSLKMLYAVLSFYPGLVISAWLLDRFKKEEVG